LKSRSKVLARRTAVLYCSSMAGRTRRIAGVLSVRIFTKLGAPAAHDGSGRRTHALRVQHRTWRQTSTAEVNSRALAHIGCEPLGQLISSACVNAGVISRTRNRSVRKASIDKAPCGFCINVGNDSILGEALRDVRGDNLAVIEVAHDGGAKVVLRCSPCLSLASSRTVVLFGSSFVIVQNRRGDRSRLPVMACPDVVKTSR
jgi:hypothetical protein